MYNWYTRYKNNEKKKNSCRGNWNLFFGLTQNYAVTGNYQVYNLVTIITFFLL